MIEADVKKAVKALCKEKGAWCKMVVPTGYGPKQLDFYICYWGRFIACETKKPGVFDCTPLQRKELNDVRQSGGYAIVENSVGLETLRAVFASIEDSPI